LSHFLQNLWHNLEGEITFWTIFGYIANLMFASRFIIQWYVSEKLKKSVIPVQFWWLSIVGSVMMLSYAIHLQKFPLILGFLFPTIIYVRNLMLIWKHKKPDTLAGEPAEESAAKK
jgi:lipid-A-disaccharide synthase-like uncharacterized protein